MTGYKIPFKNSSKFPKDKQPEHLQDDAIFDALSLEAVTSQLAIWSQTKATQEATALKMKKAERGATEGNTAVKPVTIKEGVDDATTNFHPQRYSLRPPVCGQGKIWDNYPTHWPEVYYSVNLSDVGLENQLGHKVIELLHDQRSKIEVKMFAAANANVGRTGFKTTNVKPCENGSADLVTKDEWMSLLSPNELMMALDNMVAAWSCFWEGDRSMVTLRRVVTKMKEFATIANPQVRLKVLESFINKVLEINQRKAIQNDIPMTYREVHDLAKEYVENSADHSQGLGRDRGGFSHQSSSHQTPASNEHWKAKQNREKDKKVEEIMKKFLDGQRFRGKEYCIFYNMKDEKGQSKCKNNRCHKAHMCAFIPRGSDKACAKPHPKFDHNKY